MAFILSSDGRDEDIVGTFARYRDYLSSQQARFPPGAYALATSAWYGDFRDHRCPHDAWLETFKIEEPSTGERNEIRSTSISLRMLAAYHDGHIELRYPHVYSYSLNVFNAADGHRDWRYDEFRLSDSGNLVHEIEWCGSKDVGTWLIEANDVEFQWVPASVA